MSNLSDKSKKDLNDLAKNLGLKNYSKFSKDELIKAISDAQKTSTKTTKTKSAKTEVKASEERITKQDLQAVQDAQTDMTDESGDETNQPLNINEISRTEEQLPTVKSEKHKKFLEEHVVSEGHSREKVSFETM